jgi:selenocysteine lyase/cysteine desulfurase
VGTLRASFSVYNTADDVDRLAEAVARLSSEL